MLPVLFDIGPFHVQSWGVMAAIAFAVAATLLGRELERYGQRRGDALTLAAAAAFGGLVGAKLYYLAEHVGDGSGAVSGSGFTWYGGALGGAVAVLLTARRLRIPFDVLLGSAAPALAIGYGIGRIGCQLAGDGTYGVASDLPWAMSYPHGIVPTTVAVHPTPVYETIASLLIFAVLWCLRRRIAPLNLFALYLVLAGAERVLVELIRRNDAVLLGLTQPQLWAAALAVIGGLALLRGWRAPAQARPTTAAG